MERTGKTLRLCSKILYRELTHTFVGNYSMNTYPTLYFRDWRSAVSLCHKNRAKITVLVCEQKPYPRPIQYDFRGGVKAILYSVNGKPSLSKIPPHSTTDKADSQRTLTYQCNSN